MQQLDPDQNISYTESGAFTRKSLLWTLGPKSLIIHKLASLPLLDHADWPIQWASCCETEVPSECGFTKNHMLTVH